MILYSIQPKEVVDLINLTGKFTCDINKSECVDNIGDNFYNAYNWLVGKMNQQIENPDNIQFPVWAWYKCGISGNDYPNLNVMSDSFNSGENYLIRLEIDDSCVLLSDYDIWHSVLNDSCWITGDTDEAWKAEYERIQALDNNAYEQEKLKSWELCFCTKDMENRYIQATFFELTKDMIIDIQKIEKSFDLDYVCECIIDKKELEYVSEINLELYKNFIENEKNTYMRKNHISSEFDLLDCNFLSDDVKEKLKIVKEFINEKNIECNLEK